MSYNFQDKVVIVTGGAQGLGLATVKKFLELGAKVAVGDYASDDRINAAVKELVSEGFSAHSFAYIRADVSRMKDNRKLFDLALDKFGNVDIVVCNAGICRVIPFLEMSFDDWHQILGTNLDGVFMLNQIAVAYWVENALHGVIVNISSLAAMATLSDLSAYTSSKVAVSSLTRHIAKDFASRGIRANTVNPGYTKTPMFDMYAEMANFIVDGIPQRKLGEPIDIANTVAFLASDDARYINGQSILVDGAASLT